MIWFAVLTTCWLSEAGTRQCDDYALPDRYRTISDCLIDLEQADFALRRMRSSLSRGTCSALPITLSDPS